MMRGMAQQIDESKPDAAPRYFLLPKIENTVSMPF